MDDLTEKQRRFVEAYCGPAKGNATEACRLAGYAGGDVTLASMGHENLRKPHISRAIDEVNGDIRSEAIATAEEVQAFLTGTMRGTECRAPIITMAGPVLDEAGNMVDAPAEAKDRIKAASELAKMRGYVAPTKTELEVSGVPAVTVYLPSNGRDPT
jgi:phage terminase small subunit